MFTTEQILSAHKKVKSGADFPNYIQEILALGVTHYEVFVADGRAVYYGANNHHVTIEPKYEKMYINPKPNKTYFLEQLKVHQQGNTNYHEFVKMCAKSGIEKWIMDNHSLTCTYYDLTGNEIFAETIPH